VIQQGERYLKLDASEDDTRLVVSLMLGATEGERVLAAADADGDGTVTEAESAAYLAQWAEGLRTELPVTIDGEAVELEWGEGWLDPIGPVARTDLTVEMVAHLPLESRDHEVTFEDRMVRRETFDRTDVAFRARDGAELVRCGEPGATSCEARDLAYPRGAPAPTTYAATLRFPSRSASSGWLPFAIAAAIVAALALAAHRARAKRALP
jgi:hypothetical protein